MIEEVEPGTGSSLYGRILSCGLNSRLQINAYRCCGAQIVCRFSQQASL